MLDLETEKQDKTALLVYEEGIKIDDDNICNLNLKITNGNLH